MTYTTYPRHTRATPKVLLPLIAICVWSLLAVNPPLSSAENDLSGIPDLSPHVIIGKTSPYQMATLSALQPGRIVRIPVSEGELVKKGDLLIGLDDDLQRLLTEESKAEAECTLYIERAKAEMEEAQKELQRVSKLVQGNSASVKELNQTKLLAEITRIDYQIKKFEHTQAIFEYQHQQELLQQRYIKAPFTGYISVLLKQVGESVEEQEQIITLVQLDPLEIVVDCPVNLAHMIHLGDTVPVIPADNHWTTRTGKVILTNRVADPASQTLKVKLLVANKDSRWISGLRVHIDFSKIQAQTVTTRPSTAKDKSPADQLSGITHTVSTSKDHPKE